SAGALPWIAAAHGEGREIALVLAGQYLSDAVLGTDLLGRIGEIIPDTRRGLLIDWGDRTTYDAIREASTLGQIDTFIYRPNTAVDEEFHHAVVELLGGWMRAHGRGFEGVRLVGDPFDEGTHALRDALQRSSIPFGFYDAASLAAALGVNADPGDETFDLTVVGAGPAGLAAAINGASEGMRVIVIEAEALGGQAS